MVTEQKIFLLTCFLTERSCRRDRSQDVHSREIQGTREPVTIFAVRFEGEFISENEG